MNALFAIALLLAAAGCEGMATLYGYGPLYEGGGMLVKRGGGEAEAVPISVRSSSVAAGDGPWVHGKPTFIRFGRSYSGWE